MWQGVEPYVLTRGQPTFLHCGAVCGEGFERDQCLLLGSQPDFSHFLNYPQANWALLVLIPRWMLLCSCRTLWVSPTNSPARLAVSPAASTLTSYLSRRFWGFISPPGTLGCAVCLASEFFLPVYLHANVGPPGLPAATLPQVLSAPLPISTPPTGLNECFFFNSLVVGVPYSLIFWQFWLFFVFNLVDVLFLVLQGGRVNRPLSLCRLEVSNPRNFVIPIYGSNNF